MAPPKTKLTKRTYVRRLPDAPVESIYQPQEVHEDPQTFSPLSAVEPVVSEDSELRAPKPVSAGSIQSEIERIRKIRKPLGTYSLKLALDKRPGYHRHWFNDTGARIQEALANGWSHVKDHDGKPAKQAVGFGRDNGVLNAYAMEIPQVFWDEDLAARHERANAAIESTKSQIAVDKGGKAKAEDSGKFYSPQTHADPIQIVKG